MKTRLILLIVGLMATGCSSDEFNDAGLLKDLSGSWHIQTSYIGVTVDGNYSRIVPVDYPDYQVDITSEGEISIYLITEGDPELIGAGTVSGLSKKKLLFDAAISSTLKSIGFFEAEPAHKKYSMPKFTGTSLEINYSFTNSSGEPQDEGFYLYKLGAIP